MKFCDRCYEEYENDEIVQFDKESPKWICYPCKWEFDNKLKMFLIEYFNSQPERLNDSTQKGCESLNSCESMRGESEAVFPPTSKECLQVGHEK